VDSTLAEAHAALAFVLSIYDWEWPSAEAAFQRAIRLDPSYATAHEWHGVLLDALGRLEEAEAAHRRALELDPRSLIINAVAGLHYALAGDHARAIRQLQSALDLRADFPLALEFLAQAYLLAGRHAEAEEALRRWARATGTPENPWADVVAGVLEPARKPSAAAALAELRASGVISSYRSAQYHALLGATDAALDALERAHEERDFLMYLVNADPMLASIRSEARFRAIVAGMGLLR